jgi:4-amino-4-deoxy-L-arabinose transferase-like glycosyltransferase
MHVLPPPETAFMTDRPSQDPWHRRTLILLGALLVIRLLFAYFAPLDLVGDEAYYWDWSRRLDWGYYSKPPMIAWVHALASHTTGSTTFGLRIWPVALSMGTAWMAYGLAREWFSARTGFWFTLLVACSPGMIAGGLLLTTDALLLFFWTAALWSFWRYYKGSAAAAFVLFPAIALGVLGKQMMLLFPGLAILFLALDGKDGRALLKRPRFWFGIALALCALIPPIVWNARHDWITFQHTASNMQSTTATSHRPLLSRFFSNFGGQLGVVSPLTWILSAVAGFWALRLWKRLDRPERYLTLMSVPMLLFILGVLGWKRLNPNWPAVFYPPLMLLAVARCFGEWHGRPGSGALPPSATGSHRAFFKWTVISATALASVCYTLPLLGIASGERNPAARLFARLQGWKALGVRAGVELSSFPDPERTFVLVVGHRDIASEIAFYAPSHPGVYLWNPTGEVHCQYDLWPTPAEHAGWDALIVVDGRMSPLPASLVQAFEAASSPVPVTVRSAPGIERNFTIYRMRRLVRWPTPSHSS